MKPVKKGAVKAATKKRPVKKIEKTKKPEIKKLDDVQRLVHLLQVHQVELEHQNEELRIAQVELEVSRNKYVNLFDFSPIPYFTLDIEGFIKEVNLSASMMLGIGRSKLIGKKLITYIPLNEKAIFNSFINNVFSLHQKHTSEFKLMNKDKKEYHVLLEGLEIDDSLEPDRRCQVALIDLTEYKRIEDSLKETNEELNKLNRTKDKFFSIIAHDLRRPFESLLGYSELLATEIETLSHEEVKQIGKGLNDNLKNIFGLLENLLNWSMMQRNMLEYNPKKINLYDLVNKIIGILSKGAEEKNIFLSNNIESGTPVFADVDMLRSVVQNLIINAIKFTQAEGQVIISSIEIGEFVEVCVQDNGIGIEQDNYFKLFNFGSKFTTDGTAGEKGTGLGLPLCKEFIERNGGKIWVESELGKGSKLKFTLRKSI
jgi:PAS domain S-box-containing protein